jgi:hypothetical protein
MVARTEYLCRARLPQPGNAVAPLRQAIDGNACLASCALQHRKSPLRLKITDGAGGRWHPGIALGELQHRDHLQF